MSDQLIPGLPEDVARECLLRLPYHDFPAVRAVSRQWKQEVESTLFHSLRLSVKKSSTLIALAQAETAVGSDEPEAKNSFANTPSYRLALFEPAADEWSSLPPIPGLPCGLPLFCQIAAVGQRLVVVGGWDPDTWAPSDAIHVYDFVSATWRHGASMPGPRRSFFACAASPELRAVFVAGGHDEEKKALRSALKYDVANDVWAPLADMASERDECRGIFMKGRFHVIGGYASDAQGRFSTSSEVFDLSTWRWGPMVGDTLDEAAAPRTAVVGKEGRLYLCRPRGLVEEGGDGRWRAVAEVPEDARVGPQLVTWGRSLMVMGSEKHGGPLAAYVAEDKRPLTWRRVAVPEEYSGLVHATCCCDI